jgi:uncharacterized protein (DUF4415 family)
MKKTDDLEPNWERLMAVLEGDPIPHDPGDSPHDPGVSPRDPGDSSHDPNNAKAAWDWLAQADLIRKDKIVRRGKRGPQKTPTKKLVTLRLSPEVVDYFKSTGRGWQTRIDSTLMESIKRQQ